MNNKDNMDKVNLPRLTGLHLKHWANQ